jgi:2-polyprenyl-3-methyl-5-hydroxy-6-metoxy-1,4-benzoquinol methylase
MFEFHHDKAQYFDWMYLISRDYIMPFLAPYVDLNKSLDILEIGCGEAGVLKAFLERNHRCVGVELEEQRAVSARAFLSDFGDKIKIVNRDIYEINDVENDLGSKFDIIILKDAIEHIPNQEKFIAELNKFLKPNGIVFFGFPPFQMPFGGHQQIATTKIVSRLPFIHLLPNFLYGRLLKFLGEPQHKIDELLEIKSTGISIDRFHSIVLHNRYVILENEYHLFNPIYQYKFSIPFIKLPRFLGEIPYLRNLYTMSVYALIQTRKG